MKKNNRFSLLSGVIFFVLGLLLFTHPDTFIKTISYVFGGILIIIGLFKALNYYIKDKNLQVVNRNEIAFGITAVILGLVFIFLADAIELLLRFIIGGYLIIIGLGKLLETFYTTDRTSKFYALIVVGIVFVICGIYTVVNSNLPLKIIGLFMIIYGLIDFISYFLYKDMFNLNRETKEQNKTSEIKIIDEKDEEEEKEEVEEVEFTPKDQEKSKKKGKKK